MRTAAVIIVKYASHVIALALALGWVGHYNIALVLMTAAWSTLLMFVLSDLLILRLFGEGPGLTADGVLAVITVFGVARTDGIVLSLGVLSLSTGLLLFIEFLDHALEWRRLFARP